VKVVLFGATGMVGQGVLGECLADPEVTRVVAVGRTPTGRTHETLEEILHEDFLDFSSIADRLAGLDACFFCLGVSSAGMREEAYRRITYDVTLAAAKTLADRNPRMTFVYVSGAGTDSTERGRSMWARVKGETENALLRLPFASAYMFRPAYIHPGPGIVSKTRLYRAGYAVARPLYPVLRGLFPRWVTTTERIGRAMIAVAKRGAPGPILESPDIDRLGGG
jgi:uncharacterized protein YbjT (DUF2867 family)